MGEMPACDASFNRQLGYAQTPGRAQRCAGKQPVRGRKNPPADEVSLLDRC